MEKLLDSLKMQNEMKLVGKDLTNAPGVAMPGAQALPAAGAAAPAPAPTTPQGPPK